jgi:hypothetical protein
VRGTAGVCAVNKENKIILACSRDVHSTEVGPMCDPKSQYV